MTKTFTLLFAAAALLCGTVAADAAPARAKAYAKKKTVRVDRKRARALAEQANVQYLPLKETVSVWDEDAEEWVEATATEFTYDANGRAATCVESDLIEEGEKLRLSYTYDANGGVVLQLTEASSDDGATWVNNERRIKAYDPVVTDFATENLIYRWDNGWLLSSGNKYPVTRSAGGAVTTVTRQAPIADSFEDIARVTNTVSADGKTVTSSAITEMSYNGVAYSWDEVVDLRNIVWHNTDGQVMAFDVEDYARGANRVASAESYYEDELEATLTGTYSNEFEGSLLFDFYDGSTLEISTAYTDKSTGSYVDTYELSYFDYPEDEEDVNGDGVFDDGDMVLYVEKETYEVTYDSHGNIVKEAFAGYYNDELEFAGGIINEYVYNADGAMTQMTAYNYDFDEEDRMPDYRIDVTEFQSFAGVDGVLAEGSASISVAGRTLTVSGTAASTLTVVALDGRTVATASGEGSYSVALDGLASGVYVAAVSTGADTVTAKIMLR